MTTDTLTLTDFLLARIAEDEAVARAALSDYEPNDDGVWTVAGTQEMDAERVIGEGINIYDEGGHSAGQAAHIARHDPARVLAECAAKRMIVELAASWEAQADRADGHDLDAVMLRTQAITSQTVLRQLASVYADHPDHNPDWA